MHGFQSFELSDDQWQDVKVLRVTPRGEDAWGVLSFIRETPWAEMVDVVSAEAYSHALHGWLTPLMRELSDGPLRQMQRLSCEKVCTLKQNGMCGMASPDCEPGPATPDCYHPPVEGDWTSLAHAVLAARDGYHVVVVKGEEFVFR